MGERRERGERERGERESGDRDEREIYIYEKERREKLLQRDIKKDRKSKERR